MPVNLRDISVQYLKGVGPAKQKLFANLGVMNVEDLLYFFPRRYEDRTRLTPLAEAKVGEWQTITGKVARADQRRSWYTRKHVCEIIVGDGKHQVACVWFSQPYMANYFKEGDSVVLYGKVEAYKDRLQIIAPEYEIIAQDEDESLNIGRIVPIYPLTRGLSQRMIRKVSKQALDKYVGQLKEVLPYSLRKKKNLANLAKSIINIHFPESTEQQALAYRRVAFEEFFLFQVSVTLRRLSITTKEGIVHRISEGLFKKYIEAFPFTLTGAQTRVMKEIAGDMQKPFPMHRLLQGDVGSGKTIVAFWGSVVVKANGYQSALMAPTEILARQHFMTLKNFADACLPNIRLGLLVGSLPDQEKVETIRQLKSGEIDLVIGTHALIEEKIEFKNLSYIVVDEQHKFGVRQRSFLSAKGKSPDVLVMTATPIPRSLCHTLYGDLDVSLINELPAGRGAVKTALYRGEDSAEVYRLVREFAQKGRQAYVVYPIIEESEKLDLKAAEAMFKQFQKEEFKDLAVGLVHGQMKKDRAQRVMEDFKNGQIDILVATTVLEVGIDVPNATVMVIEHAERFGLAQLHQLRGRIGRGKEDSLCILVADPTTQDAQARLKAVLSTHDGFKIAEQDLLIRGPGEFFGRHQHGLNELKIANPVTQMDILQEARQEAVSLTKKDPQLSARENIVIKELIEKRYPNYLAMVTSG